MQSAKINKKNQAYSNFINSINADATRQIYDYCLSQFLTFCKLNLQTFLTKLSTQQQTDLIIAYLVQKQVSRVYKTIIISALKHACQMNDVVLNWKKIQKFLNYKKTGNEISGKDIGRGYTHEQIQKILEYPDQRIRTCFLVLSSTGIRTGALHYLKVGDLERIDDLYKVTVYSGEKEQYITFTTPEAAKEIDTYLDFRKRRGETITADSYLIVKKFPPSEENFVGKPFKGKALWAALNDHIENSGIRQVDPINKFKRKEIPLLHGFRKFFTKQLHDSEPKIDKAVIEMLLGHDIVLTGRYYKPTDEEMLNEYLKAVPLLTISNEERLKFKLAERVQIERTQIETLKADFEKFKKDVMKRRK